MEARMKYGVPSSMDIKTNEYKKCKESMRIKLVVATAKNIFYQKTLSKICYGNDKIFMEISNLSIENKLRFINLAMKKLNMRLTLELEIEECLKLMDVI